MGNLPTDSADPPIEREPRRLHPPYDIPETAFDHLRATDTAAWRVAVRQHRLRALVEPLDGLPVTDYEHRIVEWLAGFDTPTVAVVAALLRRARAAQPPAEETGDDEDAW
jgi:hypothetical protein